MGISTNLMGKQILEGILNESNFNLRKTNIKNIDYLINENLGIKIVVRNRVNQIEADDSFYIKIASITSFDNACKDNDLSPYYCIVQILENDINILLFSLHKARERITNSGLNSRLRPTKGILFLAHQSHLGGCDLTLTGGSPKGTPGAYGTKQWT